MAIRFKPSLFYGKRYKIAVIDFIEFIINKN
jgi:hypothetical protein